MDYAELYKALTLIKETCENNEACRLCPLGDGNGGCRVGEDNPCNWDLKPNQVIRLFD